MANLSKKKNNCLRISCDAFDVRAAGRVGLAVSHVILEDT